jgi:hypothetical protein
MQMSLDPNEIHRRFVQLGEDWSDKEAGASLLEETRRSVRAEIMRQSNEKTVAAAEVFAEATIRYKEHIASMVEARRVANRAHVNFKAVQMWVEVTRSVESTKRAEMTMK